MYILILGTVVVGYRPMLQFSHVLGCVKLLSFFLTVPFQAQTDGDQSTHSIIPVIKGIFN